MCIDSDLFLNPELIPNKYTCPIGMGIIDEIVAFVCHNVSNNKKYIHTFCKECSESFFKDKLGLKCPVCSQTKTKNDLIHFSYDEILGEFEIKCENNIIGCKWQGKLCEYRDHLKICGYETDFCNLCKIPMLRNEIEIHTNTICELQNIDCEHCKFIYKRKDEINHKEEECKSCSKKKYNCTYHECQEEDINCNFCTSFIKRKDIINHQKNDCIEREETCQTCEELYIYKNNRFHNKKINCKYCNLEIDNCFKLRKMHYLECNQYPLKCKLCKDIIIRKEYNEHKKNICNYREILCNFCENTYQFINTDSHDEIQCEYCEQKYNKCTIEKHYEICNEKEIECEFIGCYQKFKRKDKDKHEIENNIVHTRFLNNLIKKCKLEDNLKKISKIDRLCGKKCNSLGDYDFDEMKKVFSNLSKNLDSNSDLDNNKKYNKNLEVNSDFDNDSQFLGELDNEVYIRNLSILIKNYNDSDTKNVDKSNVINDNIFDKYYNEINKNKKRENNLQKKKQKKTSSSSSYLSTTYSSSSSSSSSSQESLYGLDGKILKKSYIDKTKLAISNEIIKKIAKNSSNNSIVDKKYLYSDDENAFYGSYDSEYDSRRKIYDK
jgi:hypothetical protein